MKREIDQIRAKDIAQGGLTQGQQTQIARNEQRITQVGVFVNELLSGPSHIKSLVVFGASSLFFFFSFFPLSYLLSFFPFDMKVFIAHGRT